MCEREDEKKYVLRHTVWFEKKKILYFRFETSSTTMVFCIHLLSHSQTIQHEARESIKKILIKYNGQFCYEAIMEMTFLGQIIEGN